MNPIIDEKVVDYSDEHIKIKSAADHSVIFDGKIKDLQFTFKSSPENIKENNTVECAVRSLAEIKFFPHNLLSTMPDVPEIYKGYYDTVCTCLASRLWSITTTGLGICPCTTSSGLDSNLM